MLKTLTYRLVCFFLAMSFLTGCANIKTAAEKVIIAPEVVSDEIRIEKIDFQHIYFVADLEMKNSNLIALKLMEFDYQVHVEQAEFLTGHSDGIDLKANATSTVHLPFKVRLDQIFALVPELLERDELNYQFSADVKLEGPLGMTWRKNLRTTAVVPTPKIPEIKFPSVSVEKMDFYGFRLNITLPVENKNKFAINLNSLNGALVINGLKPFQIGSDQVTRLPGKSETTIDIPVELSWDKASRALLPLIQSGEMPELKLEGNWELKPELPGFDVQEEALKYGGKEGMI